MANQPDITLLLLTCSQPIKCCYAACAARGAPPIQLESSSGEMAYDSAALGSPVHVNWKDAKAKSPREQGKQLPSVSLPPTLPTALVSSSLPLLFSSDPHIISFPPAPYSWRDK